MAVVTICSDFGAQENKVWHCFYFLPPICNEVMGSDALILVFWMMSFKPDFSHSSLTFIKGLFSSSSLSAIRVESSVYLRLLIFLPAILIPACDSSSPAFFFKFYFTFKLYKIVLVLPNIKMNLPQVYMCSPSWTLHPPPSPYHASGSSQCTSPKHPVSCIEPELATRFMM